MKVRFGDLKLKDGVSIKEAMQACVKEESCGCCDYRETIECSLMPDGLNHEMDVDSIANYEIEVPYASVTAARDDRPQKDDDAERNWYKRVYICSPYRGETSLNTEAAKRFCRWAVFEKDVLPVAPHIYFTQFLDDNVPLQREIGMNMGIQWLNECSEIWVLGETLSEGMAREIAEAARLGIPIRFFTEADDGFVERK